MKGSPQDTSPKKMRRFAKFSLFIGSILITLCLLEITFRLIYYQPRGRAETPGIFRISSIPGVYYELTPNNDFTWRYDAPRLFSRGFEIPVHINSLGFRDDEIDVPKPAGTLRIVALGDSYTIAMGVPVEEGYVERLEEILNNRTGGRPGIEVVNTGVGGYSTHQEAAFMKGRGWSLQPDMVLLGFHLNDIRVPVPCHLTPDGLLESNLPKNKARRLHYQGFVYNAAEKPGFFEYIMLHSHLVRWLAGRRVKKTNRSIIFYPSKADREKTEAALLEIVQGARNRRIPFFMIIFSNLTPIKPDSPDSGRERWIESVCRAHGIPWVSMWDILKGQDMEKLIVHPKDRHPNSRAHALFAKLLARYIHIENGKIIVKNPHQNQSPLKSNTIPNRISRPQPGN